MTAGHVAVVDIGKTNVKLVLVDLADLAEIAVVTRANIVRPGPPYPHFDVDATWAFLLEQLGQFHAAYGVSAIVVTTHGAAAALLNADGELAAPIMDYEHDGPDTLTDAYDALRPPFSETGSPRLAMGLNVGAQIHYQFESVPGLRESVQTVVTYPQYWAHRLCGIAATDVTSLGAHSDLWNPYRATFSSAMDRLGLSGKMAAPRTCSDVLGTVLPDVAARTGLPGDTPVHCGIHDSNASLLPHLLGRTPPFSVVSTGTWVIAMAVGGRPVTLDPTRDTLINVNALGDPVPSARFMGGREHDLAAGEPYPEPTEADIRSVLEAGSMLMPAVVPQIGPFAGRSSQWIDHEPAEGTAERGVGVGFYLALVTCECLKLIGHRGPIVLEGPFAHNLPYRAMLAEASGYPVETNYSATGTSIGAALLAASGPGPALPDPKIDEERLSLATSRRIKGYAQRWLDCIDSL